MGNVEVKNCEIGNSEKETEDAATRVNNREYGIVEGSDSGANKSGTSSSKSGTEVNRIPIVEVKFNYKPKFDKDEYERQLNNQSKGMSKLTVAEYLENRERYNKEGRAKEGNAAQQIARQNAYINKVEELRERGISKEEAQIKAKEWLDTQAALHDPDQIAGGNPLNVTGMGDKRINYSIGSQWKKNVKIVDEHVEKYAKHMTDEEKKNTYLNVKLFI